MENQTTCRKGIVDLGVDNVQAKSLSASVRTERGRYGGNYTGKRDFLSACDEVREGNDVFRCQGFHLYFLSREIIPLSANETRRIKPEVCSKRCRYKLDRDKALGRCPLQCLVEKP